MKRKNIIYLGTDDTIIDRLNEYYEYRHEMGDHSLYTVDKIGVDDSDWESLFYKRSSRLRPHLIYVDFSDFEDERKDIYNFLDLIRGHVLLKSSVIVGFFSSSRVLEEMRVVFSLGVVFSVIKGSGVEYFKDAHYMAFDGGVRFQRFATAGNIRLPSKINVLSSLVAMTPDVVEIDFDIEIETGERVDIQQHIFEDFTCEFFNNIESQERAINYAYLRQAKMAIPYPGPWDEITDDHIQRETVETWLDLRREKEILPVGKVLIVGKNYCSKSTIELLSKFEVLILKHVSHIDNNYTVLDSFKPDVIIVELNDQNDAEDDLDCERYLKNDYTHFARVLHHIGSEHFDKRPLVVTYNNPSTSTATQKVLKYKRIISSHDKYSCELVEMLLKSYVEKVRQSKDEKYYFKNYDNRRCLEIMRDCYVTSISEHEFTFISKDPLPLFGIFEIQVPVKMYLTLVPPVRYIQGDPLGQHYMAFVHGLEENGLREIRRFVNYALEKPLERFEVAPSMPKIIEERELEREAYDTRNENEEEIPEEKDIHEEYIVDRSKTYSGISKL